MALFLRGLGMARGRKTSLTIRLTPAERQTLLAWQRATAIPAGLARRGRIVLLLADGMTITAIAATVGISRRFVYKWVQRFVQEGLEGLADKPGRRHRRRQRLADLRGQPNMDAG
jgi:CRP-like cAMP-binding protein